MIEQDLQSRYQEQLNEKEQRLITLLAPFNAPALTIFPSEPEHYRMRAEFRVWHEGDDLFYIMFNSETREKYRVDQLPAANQLINRLMPAVLNYVRDKETLRRKLFQVDFLTTTTGEALISMLYHKQLDDQWLLEINQMRDEFANFGTVNFIGRARKQKVIIDTDRVIERLNVHGRDYNFEQIENSFTQPNAQVNTKMIEWACDITGKQTHDLLELYCGNGNFSLPLAENFRRVLGTEISRTSVGSAQTNIAMNGINNARVERLPAEECAAAMKGEKLPTRLQDMDLHTYDFKTVLVDPPRAGLDDDTLAMVAEFDNIVYISCNPETLAENLVQLSRTHEVTASALFDQFPFTHHIETGVYLQKRSES
ncbi:tRNA (uridine(54)-C5)-methyltransferase TrmA [Aliidiomarina shirensis]|uniref:tRNA/tmRNA (uracil-C(5))-methyltransferase n=1 Tax=Aliidiomarina shirensis TaxID=1048642 RepID=A0A432WSG4_9GAMM|nr:tRNA (uridine(54)-C5)-methyltransferase TrmA [Aliidiomarina shirensis]RUO36694.1 tRNA (uridine(54)-C5)-methyltransferase TrmA [Aliidiomarina shirensis]